MSKTDKINGVILNGEVYVIVDNEQGCCSNCDLYRRNRKEHECIAPSWQDCPYPLRMAFSYSQPLTDKLNSDLE